MLPRTLQSLLLCAFTFGSLCYGQSTGTVRGKVTLKTNGDPLHHATVLLVQLGRSMETSVDGSFEFTEVEPGQYEVLAHMHPLTDVRQTVRVEANSTIDIDFQLALAPVHDEITVTASGREQTTLEAFQSVGTVQSLELATRASASLGDALENETGISKRSFGPGTSRPVVRGFDGDRVLILQDGISTGTLSAQSGDHGEPFDASSLERVEVVRGPATLLYGTNAIGGVVNVLTGHHQIHEHAHKGVRGYLTASGGTGNALGGGNGGFDVGLGKWMITGSGGGLRTGDYDTPLGEVENSHTRIEHATGGIARYGDRGFFNLSYGVFNGRYGIPTRPEAGHDEDGEEGHHEEEGPVDLKWRRHNVRFSGGYKNLESFVDKFTLHLNYSDWNHNEVVEEDVHTRFYNKQFTYRGVFDQRRGNLLSGSFGFSGMRRAYDVKGEEALTPTVNQDAVAVFGLEEFNLERVRLQFGGRVETNRYKPDGLRDRTFTGFSGSAGANTRLWDGGAFVVSYSDSYRAPALEELYNDGPHFGNLAYESGNPDLRRERSHGVDLSLRHVGPRVRAEANFFHYRISDYVFLARTEEFDHGLARANYQQGDARYQGAEGRLDVGLHSNFWLNLGVDSVNAKIRALNLPLPRIPPMRGRIGFDARYKGLSVRPQLLLASAQEDLFTHETRTAGYATGNLIASYTIANQHTLHAFSVNFFNMANRLYRNHVSLIKDYAAEMGRGVRVSYTVRFF